MLLVVPACYVDRTNDFVSWRGPVPRVFVGILARTPDLRQPGGCVHLAVQQSR